MNCSRLRSSPLPGGSFCAVVARQADAFEVRERMYAPGLRFERHHHAHTSLFAVLSGGVDETSSMTTFACRGGTSGLIPAGVDHRSEFGNAVVHSLDVVFDAAWLERCGIWPRVPREGLYARGDALSACAHRLLRACRRPDADHRLAAEELVLELVSRTLEPGLDSRRTQRGAAPGWLDGVIDLVRGADPARELSTIAEAVGRDPGHICRAFRAAFGCSVHEYARLIRIERAAVLLRTTEDPLVQIAMATGFSDQAHFTRTFKGMMGVTPLVYRRSVG